MEYKVVLCKCGSPCAQYTVKKEGVNQGRPFFSCAHRACQTFIWADEEPEETPLCKCKQSTIKLMVKKEGPNQGKQFYKCKNNQCNYFEFI
jgi:DNA topoisomerase-3